MWDWRFRRVANVALAVAATVGLGMLLTTGRGPVASSGWDGLGGLAVATLWWLPGLMLRQVGAGDVKFAACIGLLLGTAAAFEAMVLAALVLGVMSAVTRIKSKRDVRMPAAVPLSAGMLVQLGWGPIWMG